MDIYSPKYSVSRALIVGIDKYEKTGPLSYAVNDANGVMEALVKKFGFLKENIRFLTDKAATRDGIRRAYLSFSAEGSAPDDRLIVFFAGHGTTRTGRRGEVGYLVPVDGNLDDLSTLVSWNDLTDNSTLIRAKHILFIMDVCYGGLALTRSVPPGGVRFLNDMLQRYSRQVITAGKPDEVVADSGGPIPNHSVFTGHLLEALGGKAVTGDGILTASGIMAYVYDRVSKDLKSHQTPHYGFLDGDGDFIFSGFEKNPKAEEPPTTEGDILIDVPAAGVDSPSDSDESLVETVKALLAEDRNTIKLHDLMNSELRKYLGRTSGDLFTTHGGGWSVDGFVERLKQYENVSSRLLKSTAVIAYWGGDVHRPLIEKIFLRMTDHLEPEGGLTVWLALRWYPVLLLAYAAGISAIAAGKYENLEAIFSARIPSSRSPSQPKAFTSALADALSESGDAFKTLPGHEKKYVPFSEHMYQLLQPTLDDLLFVGRGYEKVFDRFEVLFSIDCAIHQKDEHGIVWGPIGRFGWKAQRRFMGGSPFADILQEATKEGKSWPPIKSGMFRGDSSLFLQIASQYSENLLKNLHWF